MFDQTSAATMAASSTPELPDSVRRNARSGAAASRVVQIVRSRMVGEAFGSVMACRGGRGLDGGNRGVGL